MSNRLKLYLPENFYFLFFMYFFMYFFIYLSVFHLFTLSGEESVVGRRWVAYSGWLDCLAGLPGWTAWLDWLDVVTGAAASV